MLFAILTGLSLSMDAFAISVTNGMTMKGFRFRHAVVMALYFGAFQFLMPLAGSFLAGRGAVERGYHAGDARNLADLL